MLVPLIVASIRRFGITRYAMPPGTAATRNRSIPETIRTSRAQRNAQSPRSHRMNLDSIRTALSCETQRQFARWPVAAALATGLAASSHVSAQDFDIVEPILDNTNGFSGYLGPYQGIQLGGTAAAGHAVVFLSLDDFVIHNFGIGVHPVTAPPGDSYVQYYVNLSRMRTNDAIEPNANILDVSSSNTPLDFAYWHSFGSLHEWNPTILRRGGRYAVIASGEQWGGSYYWSDPNTWPSDPSRAGAIALGTASRWSWNSEWSPIQFGDSYHRSVGIRGRYRPSGEGRVIGWGCDPSYGYGTSGCSFIDPLPSAVSLACSLNLTGVVRADGTVRFLDGASQQQWLSFSQPFPDRVASISMRGNALLALLENGTVVARVTCCDNPTVPDDLGSAIAVATGGLHFAALRPDGSVRCWGSDTFGQSAVPDDLGPATAIAAGDEFTLALLADGTVRAWGRNNSGQCDVPADLQGVVAISAGGSHAAALLENGSIRCWGNNGHGQCSTPPDLGTVVSVAAGGQHTVALLSDGTLRCWGSNQFGQCDVPDDAVDVIAIAAGLNHTAAIKTADFNRNGLSDWEEIAAGDLADCNENLTSDHWERLDRRHSVGRSPFMGGQPAEFRLTQAPASSGDPTLIVSVRGDLAGASRFVGVHLNDQLVATLFVADGLACGEETQIRDIIIPQAQYEAARQSGQVVVRLAPSPFIGACPTSSARVSWHVPTFRDCDQDGQWDNCQIHSDPFLDCNRNGTIDGCEPPLPDCDDDGIPNACVLLANPQLDCNGNAIPDSCDIAANSSLDCDADGKIDTCQIALDALLDCNQNGTLDACEPDFSDCNANGASDPCEILADPSLDLNADNVLDSCSLGVGDFNLDGIVDGADLGVLLAVWGLKNPEIGDLSGDGVVDGADLSILLGNWGVVQP